MNKMSLVETATQLEDVMEWLERDGECDLVRDDLRWLLTVADLVRSALGKRDE